MVTQKSVVHGAVSGRPVGAEAVIAALAARQHAVVTRAQLLDAGVSGHQVDRRLRTGRLRRIHHGVYLAGPVSTTYTLEMAAMLACGERSVISHFSAAYLWELAGAQDGRVEIVAPGYRSRSGIVVRRLRALRADEATTRHGIRVTTPARTLVDLASVLPYRDLRRTVADAVARRLVEEEQILAILDRHPRSPGAGRLREVLGRGRVSVTRSGGEDALLALIGSGQLPVPEVNARVEGFEVDVVWREERLVVEMDGFATHSPRSRFESDRRRDAILTAAGYRVIRVTWHQLDGERDAVLVRIAQALVRK